MKKSTYRLGDFGLLVHIFFVQISMQEGKGRKKKSRARSPVVLDSLSKMELMGRDPPKMKATKQRGRKRERDKKKQFVRIWKRYFWVGIAFRRCTHGVPNEAKKSWPKRNFNNRNSWVFACFLLFIIIFSVKSWIVRCRCRHVCASERTPRTGGSYDEYFGKKHDDNGSAMRLAHMSMSLYGCTCFFFLYSFFGISFARSVSIND